MLSREEIEKLMREGSDAFLNRMSLFDCPYRISTQQFASWTRGYRNAAYGAAHLEKHHD